LYFKLSNWKFAKDLKKTQTQNPNTQQIENPNPDLNLWVLLGAYFWLHKRIEREIKRFLKILFFDGAE